MTDKPNAREAVLNKLKAAAAARTGSKRSVKDLAAAGQKHPDPLADVPDTGDLEADSKAELNRLGKGLSGASKDWQKKYGQMRDSEYWVAFCFASRTEKDAFLVRLKLIDLGDKYIDGHEAALRMGFSVDPDEIPSTPKVKKS